MHALALLWHAHYLAAAMPGEVPGTYSHTHALAAPAQSAAPTVEPLPSFLDGSVSATTLAETTVATHSSLLVFTEEDLVIARGLCESADIIEILPVPFPHSRICTVAAALKALAISDRGAAACAWGRLMSHAFAHGVDDRATGAAAAKTCEESRGTSLGAAPARYLALARIFIPFFAGAAEPHGVDLAECAEHSDDTARMCAALAFVTLQELDLCVVTCTSLSRLVMAIRPCAHPTSCAAGTQALEDIWACDEYQKIELDAAAALKKCAGVEPAASLLRQALTLLCKAAQHGRAPMLDLIIDTATRDEPIGMVFSGKSYPRAPTVLGSQAEHRMRTWLRTLGPGFFAPFTPNGCVMSWPALALSEDSSDEEGLEEAGGDALQKDIGCVFVTDKITGELLKCLDACIAAGATRKLVYTGCLLPDGAVSAACAQCQEFEYYPPLLPSTDEFVALAALIKAHPTAHYVLAHASEDTLRALKDACATNGAGPSICIG